MGCGSSRIEQLHQFFNAAKVGDVNTLTEILSENPVLVYEKDIVHGTTALIYASIYGQEASVELLLKNGADPNRRNKHKSSPLQCASYEGWLVIVAMLLRKGADPNRRGRDGRTPMYCASLKGHLEIVRILLENGANPNKRNLDFFYKEIPLHAASRAGYTEIVKLLIEHGTDTNTRSKDKSTPLLCASLHGKTNTILLLLENQADPNIPNLSHDTPLSVAATAGFIHVVNILLQKGADPNTKTAKDGSNSLHLAVRGGHTSIAALLLANGADPNAKNRLHRTALDEANQYLDCVPQQRMQNPEKKTFILSYNEQNQQLEKENTYSDMVRLLLENKANPNGRNNFKETEAPVFSMENHVPNVGHPPNCTFPNNHIVCENIPSHSLSKKGYISTGMLLLEMKAGSNDQVDNTDTTIHHTAWVQRDAMPTS